LSVGSNSTGGGYLKPSDSGVLVGLGGLGVGVVPVCVGSAVAAGLVSVGLVWVSSGRAVAVSVGRTVASLLGVRVGACVGCTCTCSSGLGVEVTTTIQGVCVGGGMVGSGVEPHPAKALAKVATKISAASSFLITGTTCLFKRHTVWLAGCHAKHSGSWAALAQTTQGPVPTCTSTPPWP
jgi:hypothetical protein